MLKICHPQSKHCYWLFFHKKRTVSCNFEGFHSFSPQSQLGYFFVCVCVHCFSPPPPQTFALSPNKRLWHCTLERWPTKGISLLNWYSFCVSCQNILKQWRLVKRADLLAIHLKKGGWDRISAVMAHFYILSIWQEDCFCFFSYVACEPVSVQQMWLILLFPWHLKNICKKESMGYLLSLVFRPNQSIDRACIFINLTVGVWN